MSRPRRRLHVLALNWAALVLVRGVVGWGRNLLSVTPAVASMMVLLAGGAATAIAGIGVVTAVTAEAGQAAVLHVYLADGATPDQVAALESKLAADRRVRGVSLIDREEALRRALGRPGVGGLVDAAGSNPFPANLDVRVDSADAVPDVAAAAASDPAVDPAFPTSYDPGAYGRLHHLLYTGAAVAAGVLAVLAFIAIAVMVNAIRAAVVARRDEIRVMRLVGAPWWAVRAPFVIEGGLTGAAAAALAALATTGSASLLLSAGPAVFIQVLPGVDSLELGIVAAGTLFGGVVLGAGSGAVALFRMP